LYEQLAHLCSHFEQHDHLLLVTRQARARNVAGWMEAEMRLEETAERATPGAVEHLRELREVEVELEVRHFEGKVDTRSVKELQTRQHLVTAHGVRAFSPARGGRFPHDAAAALGFEILFEDFDQAATAFQSRLLAELASLVAQSSSSHLAVIPHRELAAIPFNSLLDACPNLHSLTVAPSLDLEAGALNHLAQIYYATGEVHKSLECFKQALARHRSAGDKPGEAAALNNLGHLYFSVGELRDAKDYHERSLVLKRALNDRRGVALTLNNLARAFWESNLPSMGREQLRAAFDESIEFGNIVSTLTASGAPSPAVSSLATARADPFNQTGDQLRARDCEWSVNLLSLPGRAGLDLGLSLSYSSLVWTHSGPYAYFDEDRGSPSPGFHIGFPMIKGPYFDAQVGSNVYTLITSMGSRVEMRQVGATSTYEAGDSTHLQLIAGGSLLLSATDGTLMSFSSSANGWRHHERHGHARSGHNLQL
jgi:tetratricopeptide (TPR) repeat protein